MKRIYLIAMTLIFLANLSQANNILKMRKLDSKEQVEYISQFTKIKFRNDSIFIYNKANELVSKNALVNVQVIIFDEDEEPVVTSVDEIVNSDYTVSLYPNPATYSIQVENYEPLTNIAVYALTGEQLSVDYNTDETIATVNVSTLGAGTYILLINQTAVKFIKQ